MFENVETSAVEAELVGLAGHLAAATCRLLQLLAVFDDRDGWAGPGLRSCAHWLNWRVGMSLRTARDHLRVAHALTVLPATTAAFTSGRVSYSKVRALTRIATPDSETTLLNVALHGTTSQMEALVRAARAGADPRPAQARRGLFTSRAADGSLLVRLRVPAELGDELLAAIQAYLDQHPDDQHPDPTDPRDPADPAGGSAEPSHAGNHHPGDEDQDVVDQHGEIQPGTDHAVDSAAVGPGQLLRSGLEHGPGAVVDPLAARRLDALLEMVRSDPTARSTTLVVHLRVDGSGPSPAPCTNPIGATAWIEGGPVIPPTTAERLGCTAAVEALLVDRRGNPLFLGRTRRTASPAQIRALRARDGDTCRFPGCTCTRGLEAHHVRWWYRDGGRTDLDQMALICGFHHTLIHDHGYRCDLTDAHLVFTRPDGTPIAACGPPTAGAADDLVARHVREHLTIDDTTITPRWGGERLDPTPILRWLIPDIRQFAHQ